VFAIGDAIRTSAIGAKGTAGTHLTQRFGAKASAASHLIRRIGAKAPGIGDAGPQCGETLLDLPSPGGRALYRSSSMSRAGRLEFGRSPRAQLSGIPV
jgi:hypothetical protein